MARGLFGRSRAQQWIVAGMLLLAGCLWLWQRAERRAPEQLRQIAAAHGIRLLLGPIERHWFTTSVYATELRLVSAPLFAAHIDALTISASLFGKPRVSVDAISLGLTGEPTDLYAQLQALATCDELGWRCRRIDATYTHRVGGRVRFEDLHLAKRGDSTLVSAKDSSIGLAHFPDLDMVVSKRNQLIEVGVGATKLQNAPIQLRFFPAGNGTAQWSAAIQHQPARALGQRHGWDPGPSFDATLIVGSTTLLVPENDEQPIRGSLHLTLDRWPKPDWPESIALLGNSVGLSAGLVTSSELRTWELPNVEVTTLLFSLKGTGRIQFGDTLSIAIDVNGSRSCAQLLGNLPPSQYFDAVKHYVERGAEGTATASVAVRSKERVSLRLQLLAETSAAGPRHVAWLLSAGCGIRELRDGDFVAMPQRTALP